VEATGRLPNPAPGGWQCARPAASRPQDGWRYRARLALSDGQQFSAASSGGAAV